MSPAANEPDTWFRHLVHDLRRNAEAARQAEQLAVQGIEQELAMLRDAAVLPAAITALEAEIAGLEEEGHRLEAELARLRAEREGRRREDQDRLFAAVDILLETRRQRHHRELLDDAAELFDDRARRSGGRPLAALSPRQLEAFLADLEASGRLQRVRQEIRTRFLAVWEATRNALEERQQAALVRSANEERRGEIAELRQRLAHHHEVNDAVLECLSRGDLQLLERLRSETLGPWLEQARGEAALQLPLDVLAAGQPGGGFP